MQSLRLDNVLYNSSFDYQLSVSSNLLEVGSQEQAKNNNHLDVEAVIDDNQAIAISTDEILFGDYLEHTIEIKEDDVCSLSVNVSLTWQLPVSTYDSLLTQTTIYSFYSLVAHIPSAQSSPRTFFPDSYQLCTSQPIMLFLLSA